MNRKWIQSVILNSKTERRGWPASGISETYLSTRTRCYRHARSSSPGDPSLRQSVLFSRWILSNRIAAGLINSIWNNERRISVGRRKVSISRIDGVPRRGQIRLACLSNFTRSIYNPIAINSTRTTNRGNITRSRRAPSNAIHPIPCSSPLYYRTLINLCRAPFRCQWKCRMWKNARSDFKENSKTQYGLQYSVRYTLGIQWHSSRGGYIFQVSSCASTSLFLHKLFSINA